MRWVLLASLAAGQAHAATQLAKSTRSSLPLAALRDGVLHYFDSALHTFVRSNETGRFSAIQEQTEYCGVTGDGVRCWKRPTSPAEEHTTFAGLPPGALAVFEHFCAIDSNGGVFCRDDENSLYKKRPLPAGTGRPRALSGSHDHACLLGEDGAVLCLGSNRSGKLGFAEDPRRRHLVENEELLPFWRHYLLAPPLPFPTWGPPAAVPGRSVFFQAVSVQNDTSCALSDERENNLYCWGQLSSLRMASGDAGLALLQTAYAAAPRRLSLPSGVRFAAGATGDLSFCGVTPDDRLLCTADLGRDLRWAEVSLGAARAPLGSLVVATDAVWAVDARGAVFRRHTTKLKAVPFAR